MKKSEFRQLIREEIKRVMSEVDPIPAGGYKPVGLGVVLSVIGKTSDGTQFTGPYKLATDFKIKIRILQKDSGYDVPGIEYMSLFRNQMIGRDLGRVEIQFNVPFGPVKQMGKALMDMINEAFSSGQVDAGRATLGDSDQLKSVVTNAIFSKWPQLTDAAINNPKSLQMMRGMGAAIDRVASVQ